MIEITRNHTIPWPFGQHTRHTRLSWYSSRRQAFIVGDHARKWAFPLDDPGAPQPLVDRQPPYPGRTTVYDDRLPLDDYLELAQSGIDRFQLLTHQQYDHAFPNREWGTFCPTDQALIAGVTNQLPLCHPVHAAIVSFSDRKIQLHTLNEDGLAIIDETRVRSRQALTAVTPHLQQGYLYYGTNFGEVVAVPVAPSQFGRQQRVVTYARGIKALRMRQDGQRLFVGGLGALFVIAVENGTYQIMEERPMACRSIELSADDRWLIVNHGIHGFTIYDTAKDQLEPVAAYTTDEAIDTLTSSRDGMTLLAISTRSRELSFYRVGYGT